MKFGCKEYFAIEILLERLGAQLSKSSGMRRTPCNCQPRKNLKLSVYLLKLIDTLMNRSLEELKMFLILPNFHLCFYDSIETR
jgi:hypothetical protein